MLTLGRDFPACTHRQTIVQQQTDQTRTFWEQLLAKNQTFGNQWNLACHRNAGNDQLQTVQIDAAIRLLQMQYNHLMAQVVGQHLAHTSEEFGNVNNVVNGLVGPAQACTPAQEKVAPAEATEATETVQSKKRRRDDTNHQSGNEPHAPANGYGSVVLNQKASRVAIVFYNLVLMPLSALQSRPHEKYTCSDPRSGIGEAGNPTPGARKSPRVTA